MNNKKFSPGDKEIYENVFDGLSFYQTTGEVYHTSRSKLKFHQMYKHALTGRSSVRVLDIGCFIGTELFMLPKTSCKVKRWGIDVSKSAINHASNLSLKRSERNIKFQSVDANSKLPFKDSFFDIVYALELVEHLSNPQQFFEEASRILKPNGVLIISTPNPTNIQQFLLRFLPKKIKEPLSKARSEDFSRHGDSFDVDQDVWDKDAHISLFSPSKWVDIASLFKLKLLKMEGSSFFGGSRYASDRPWLLGILIFIDWVIDKLPLKPYLQMCLVASFINKK